MVPPASQVQAPVRSLDQRMEALKRANDIRVKRAKLKKDLKSGAVSIEQILAEPPEYVSTAKVFDMLMAVPKFGRVKSLRMLNQCRISQSKTVGGLSDRQRQELLARIPRLRLAVSATTRARRPGEVDGVHYWFISDEEFDRRLAEGDFLEYHVFPWGQRSGTLLSELDRIAAAGNIPLLELELNG